MLSESQIKQQYYNIKNSIVRNKFGVVLIEFFIILRDFCVYLPRYKQTSMQSSQLNVLGLYLTIKQSN